MLQAPACSLGFSRFLSVQLVLLGRSRQGEWFIAWLDFVLSVRELGPRSWVPGTCGAEANVTSTVLRPQELSRRLPYERPQDWKWELKTYPPRVPSESLPVSFPTGLGVL